MSKLFSSPSKTLMLCADLTDKALWLKNWFKNHPVSPQSPNLWSSLRNNFQSALFPKFVVFGMQSYPSPLPLLWRGGWDLQFSIVITVLLEDYKCRIWLSIVKAKSNIANFMLWLFTLFKTKWGSGHCLVLLIYAGETRLIQHLLLLLSSFCLVLCTQKQC